MTFADIKKGMLMRENPSRAAGGAAGLVFGGGAIPSGI